ncbi:glutathione S-transferase [Endozoicomonas sp. OPT23]|uniref:glutathione S-transferase family protein n=1 Tax=Endozoicomonas sp. OPT23 TaxID=2072845 RepID=UPI00129AD7FD|nr:glutathione S-transferase family protein [Endozoicomonas sp. OPT23]MRI34617.1 glutathione S-transferase [Endozoicomonas sp. OPT23]
MILYGDSQSGNCYKIKLLFSLLNIEHQWVHVDILNGDSHTPAFLQKNPTGKIPLLELSDDQYLSESNAILNYLAAGSELYPQDTFQQALIQQWQFFEQYSHEPYIAVARFINKYQGMPDERKAEFYNKQDGGHKALHIMEQQLQTAPFLTGEQMTTADISLYGYTHVADEGGFDLKKYPAIKQWLLKIEEAPDYLAMED